MQKWYDFIYECGFVCMYIYMCVFVKKNFGNVYKIMFVIVFEVFKLSINIERDVYYVFFYIF